MHLKFDNLSGQVFSFLCLYVPQSLSLINKGNSGQNSKFQTHVTFSLFNIFWIGLKHEKTMNFLFKIKLAHFRVRKIDFGRCSAYVLYPPPTCFV